MTAETGESSSILDDKWLILIVLTIVLVTAWNSRYSILPTPDGYSRYADHGIVILQPDDLYIWELAVHEDGNIVIDGSGLISKESGIVGWNGHNSNNPEPLPTVNWQESSVIWVKTEPPEDFELRLYYNQLYTYAIRNNMEINITKGEINAFTHLNHKGKLQYCNYTLKTMDTAEKTMNYGIVAGYYCEKTHRTIELFYIDIFESDPEYDQEKLYNGFNFILDSLHCH
jgi:hypothetical protein